MKVAIVHDWLTGMRGGERCLEYFLALYPEADLFALLHRPGSVSSRIESRLKGTSFLQRLPGIWRYYRVALPLYPLAVAGLSLKEYDLVISLSHAAVKNVRIRDGAKHICYCFTPMRYVWDQIDAYLGAFKIVVWPMVALLRRWDVARSGSVTSFVAISRFVAARIRCFYKRRAAVIFPPVATSWISPREEGEAGSYFLVAGALVPYKRVDIAMEAVRGLPCEVLVAGTGPQEAELRRRAPPNVKFLGKVGDVELARLYRGCRALLFPGVEDFGMIPVECLAAGRPVIGFGEGGLRETVRGINASSIPEDGRPDGLRGDPPEGPRSPAATGVFAVASQERGGRDREGLVEAFRGALRAFMRHESRFTAGSCREQAQRFSPRVFLESWQAVEEEVLGKPLEDFASRWQRLSQIERDT